MQPCFDGLFDVLKKKCHTDPAYVLTGGGQLQIHSICSQNI